MAAVAREYAAFVQFLQSRSAATLDHVTGTLLEHLDGTYELLRQRVVGSHVSRRSGALAQGGRARRRSQTHSRCRGELGGCISRGVSRQPQASGGAGGRVEGAVEGGDCQPADGGRADVRPSTRPGVFARIVASGFNRTLPAKASGRSPASRRAKLLEEILHRQPSLRQAIVERPLAEHVDGVPVLLQPVRVVVRSQESRGILDVRNQPW
jgi:hypothetical protein